MLSKRESLFRDGEKEGGKEGDYQGVNRRIVKQEIHLYTKKNGIVGGFEKKYQRNQFISD